MQQQDLCAALKNKGLAHARKFSWKKYTQETLALFEQVLQKKCNIPIAPRAIPVHNSQSEL